MQEHSATLFFLSLFCLHLAFRSIIICVGQREKHLFAQVDINAAHSKSMLFGMQVQPQRCGDKCIITHIKGSWCCLLLPTSVRKEIDYCFNVVGSLRDACGSKCH